MRAGFNKPYPEEFVYGQGEADPGAWSLSGLKIARALKALPGISGSILELGCGGGQYLRALQRYRPELKLHAVDLDPRAVAGVKTIPGVIGVEADIKQLPFAADKFSAVMGFDILEHVKDPMQVLIECNRVLKLKGLLHFYIPCEGNLRTIYIKRGHAEKAKWGGHCQQYTTEKIVAMVRQAGFEITRLRYADYWLTQRFDYAFFKQLSRTSNKDALWAAQALQPGGGLPGLILRIARRLLSFLAWAESRLRHSPSGAMGVHITAKKIAT